MRIDNNHIYVTTSKQNTNIMKYRLNGIWSAKNQAWRFPKSTHALKEIEQEIPDLKKNEAFQEIKSHLNAQRKKLKQLKEQQPQTQAQTPTPNELRPYQQQDTAYLAKLPSAAILNQPRTGKTPTLIETLKQKQTIYNAIIAPASLTQNWKKEIEKWHPVAKVIIYHGTLKKKIDALAQFETYADTTANNKPRYLIVSKDTAKRDLETLKQLQLDTLTVDEAHYLRNIDTAQSNAILALGKLAKHRYALTGTPTVKHPADIFGILKFLYPEKFTSKWQFLERYFHISEGYFGREVGELKANRADELKDLIDAMSTQRLRKDVMQWLPDKTRHTHTLTIEGKQEKLYKQMAEDFIAKLEESEQEIDAQNILAQLMRLRQLALDPQLLGFDAPSAKTAAILEAIDNGTYAEQGEPIIIMSMFTSYLKLLTPHLEKMGKRIGTITGDMTPTEKQQTAERFQRGEIDVLLCNIISAGTGFTLDRGEVIIFLDKHWNPSENEQAEDRITPTKQENNHKHTIISFICENTVEKHIENILINKQDMTKILNDLKSVDQLRRFML